MALFFAPAIGIYIAFNAFEIMIWADCRTQKQIADGQLFADNDSTRCKRVFYALEAPVFLHLDLPGGNRSITTNSREM